MKRLLCIAFLLAFYAQAQTYHLLGNRSQRTYVGGVAVWQAWSPTSLSPVAWWQGDGNALDSASTNNGTWTGTESYTNGVNAQAFNFSRTNYVSDGSAFSPTQLTMCAWVRIPSAQTTYARIVGCESKWSVLVSAADGKGLRFFGSGLDAAFPVGSLNYGEWTHVVVTYDTQLKLYTNGAYASALALASLTSATGTPLIIGNRVGADRGLVGAVDDVLIFDRALTQSEITQLYQWRQ